MNFAEKKSKFIPKSEFYSHSSNTMSPQAPIFFSCISEEYFYFSSDLANPTYFWLFHRIKNQWDWSFFDPTTASNSSVEVNYYVFNLLWSSEGTFARVRTSLKRLDFLKKITLLFIRLGLPFVFLGLPFLLLGLHFLSPGTPLYAPWTPLDSAWTPLYCPWTPFYCSWTPLYSPWTPLYSPWTPLYSPQAPLSSPNIWIAICFCV